MKSKIYILLLLILFVVSSSVSGQKKNSTDSLFSAAEDLGDFFLNRNQDTTYIRNYTNYVAAKFLGINKYNLLTATDRNAKNFVRYRPDFRVNLGFGFSYRWFSLDLAFNSGIGESSDFQNSRVVDLQIHVFTSKQYVSASVIYYFGYKLSAINVDDRTLGDFSQIRDDMRYFQSTVQYIFVFNYDKFSLKAPFISNEAQQKSAGSWLFGASFNNFNIVSDSSIIPSLVQNEFNENLRTTNYNLFGIGANFGYMHSFVLNKKFFFTISAIPGISLNMGDNLTTSRKPIEPNIDFMFKTMNAIGYNSSRFFIGVQALADLYWNGAEDKTFMHITSGRFKGFVGYRFKTKRSR